jgi:hypothetical protein
MNDLISKATFGFLMAQLFPGAIAVFAIGSAYFALQPNHPPTLLAAASRQLTIWGAASLGEQLFLIGLCIGAGMIIHGLNWAVLGALENHLKGSVFNAPFHAQRIFIQILLAPVRAVIELFTFLYVPKDIRDVRMPENVANITKDEMAQFQWLQDFYLYSAQFFAHVSIALGLVILALVEFAIVHGVTFRRFTIFVLLYFLMGLCFTLGRIQFASLFLAETTMADRHAPSQAAAVPNGPAAPIAAPAPNSA